MEDLPEQAMTRLQLARLPEMTELARPLARTLALAGSVALCGFHETPEVPAMVTGTPVGPGEGRPIGTCLRPDSLRAIISRLAVGAVELATFADPDEAVELGAAGVGCSVAHTCLHHVAFRRLPTGTGADYLMRPLDPTAGGPAVESDARLRVRLECSGIGRGSDTVAGRLRQKVEQLGRGSERTDGYAIVTRFSSQPVEIGVRGWGQGG